MMLFASAVREFLTHKKSVRHTLSPVPSAKERTPPMLNAAPCACAVPSS